ncbi:hypothetical protein H310_11022 [Aphanomyces invadans]|uniref:DDE Tnp4 domain-containing protein n=1 Tax=Aphanomyces invadans TaxID=157072 RepID=A0A024TQG1_9STRA|nr:hypothetical protein H310_11022 [Aphanomyces invadans]ETV95587.1 hypothetical protein H310_11022 [Aphanomyces invadans]|eukprot:XP_008875780.1 hypothetical protein H310_11022 [Aphanomyces invadans]
MTYLAVLHPFLYRKFVEAAAEKWTMTRLASMNQRFTNIPSGSYVEKMLFLSGKHHLYGHKVEMSAIFDGNVEFHRINLAKKGSESSMADAGQEEDAIARWAVLVDKSYQGIQHQVRGIIPSKKPAHGILDFEQLRENDRIASDRAIVESFFGRLKLLWGVCSDTYRWDRNNYDMLVQTCVALTNVHVRFHPLRSEDGDAYAHAILLVFTVQSVKLAWLLLWFP